MSSYRDRYGPGGTEDADDSVVDDDLYNDPEFMELEGYVPPRPRRPQPKRRPGNLNGAQYWFNRPRFN